jgi:hypothetical protein
MVRIADQLDRVSAQLAGVADQVHGLGQHASWAVGVEPLNLVNERE